MRIALAGTGRLGVSLLMPLVKSSHEVVAIVQDGRRLKGLRRWAAPVAGQVLGGEQSVAGRARALGIPIVWIAKMTPEELAPLRALGIDLLLVGGFSIILKKPLLELPRVGCLNTHSSLLPRHRGPNPFYAVILAGDAESGVTFHEMEEGIDTGPIVEQVRFPMSPRDTVLTVYQRACAVAGEHVVAVVDRVARDGLHGTPQDPALANYVKKPTIDDSWLDWSRPAIELDRQVRALSPSPMPRFKYKGRIVRVGRTEFDPALVDAAPGTVVGSRVVVRVATGQGALTLRVAFCTWPVPWIWPAPWGRPVVGEVLR
ncbi:MAG: methionyl-tRNA formyltransferase [Candidatus Hydrogenedentes bacterium]|nr:methionyl-tRNA formyltransferase [Candidatus Hydrogenedentota bacterium]